MRPPARRRLLALMLIVVAAAAPPTPQDMSDALRAQGQAEDAARDAARQAQTQAAEADRMAMARVAATTDLLATENQLADLTARIGALTTQQNDADAAMAAQARRLAPLLPLAERLGLYPAETLLSVPASPEDAVRGLIVLQGLARQIRAAIADARAGRDRAAATLRDVQAARQALIDATARRRAQAASLDALLTQARARRDQARDDAASAAARAAATAARAVSLRAAIADLAAASRRRDAAGTAAAQVSAPGSWSQPVAGRLISAFGAATEAGPASGVTYQAAGGGRVAAPCAGPVVFAGPFRSYGKLLIIQCAPDLHAVLAGLGRLDASVGQKLRGGEPVGVMDAAGGNLYMEVRRAGLAIDPGQYLRR